MMLNASVQVLLVTQIENPSGFRGNISAIWNGIVRIYRDGGLLSFYRGNGLNIIKIAPESALKFFVFEYCKTAIGRHRGQNNDDIGVGGRFVAGGIAGLVSQFAIYPLETVKTRMMAQIAQGARADRVAVDLASGTHGAEAADATRLGKGAPRADKITGSTRIEPAVSSSGRMLFAKPSPFSASLTQSNAPPFLSLSPLPSSSSSQPPPSSSSTSSSPSSPSSPSCSRRSHQTTTAPPSATKTPGLILSTCRSIWREGGVHAFYRGCIPSLVGIMPYAGIDLAVFETLKLAYQKYLRSRTSATDAPGVKDADQPSMGAVLGIGMISGACGATLMYPLSVVRTRLQAQGTPSHPTRYSSALDVVRKTYSREGIGGFYKGLAPTLLKVLPAVSISYVVYERCKRALDIA
ncbi:hypothetical protein HK104_000325 [Borealophlyctis nickersoniae]|nr:hypothetical protein HK104_000325 [Borealophlyctis nickersoniae]